MFVIKAKVLILHMFDLPKVLKSNGTDGWWIKFSCRLKNLINQYINWMIGSCLLVNVYWNSSQSQSFHLYWFELPCVNLNLLYFRRKYKAVPSKFGCFGISNKWKISIFGLKCEDNLIQTWIFRDEISWVWVFMLDCHQTLHLKLLTSDFNMILILWKDTFKPSDDTLESLNYSLIILIKHVKMKSKYFEWYTWFSKNLIMNLVQFLKKHTTNMYMSLESWGRTDCIYQLKFT